MKKRFFTIQLILVILLTICTIGVTYTWSTRPAINGGFEVTPFELNYSSSVNGNSCTAITYQGTVDDKGNVTYPNPDNTTATPVTSVSVATRTQGEKLYFRTYITNGHETAATNVTLLINSVTTGGTLNNNVTLRTFSPVVKEISYADSTEKWLPVVSQYEVQGNGTVYVEWYIQFNQAGSFGISKIALANN